MMWQDLAVAAIGILLAAYLAIKLVRSIRGNKSGSCSCGCSVADQCPSAKGQNLEESANCDHKTIK